MLSSFVIRKTLKLKLINDNKTDVSRVLVNVKLSLKKSFMEVKMIVRLVALLIVANCAMFCNGNEDNATDSDDKIFKHLCSFDSDNSVVEGEDFCKCDLVSSPLIGRPTVKIDCLVSERVANLRNEIFSAEKLPLNTVSLVLSFQLFTEVPEFTGSLIDLDLSNNKIRVIKKFNFMHVTSLERLDLSYNVIADIEPNAFSYLTLLHSLDLSNNQLVVIPANVFAPLVTLKTLKLSGNEGFGRLLGKDAVNSSLTEIYLQLGVSPQLETLEMEKCNLTKINLLHGAGLHNLNLGEF